MRENGIFLRKTSLRQNRFFLFCYNSKTNRCKYLKFSPNVYISALRTHSNLYEIYQNCENLQFFISYSYSDIIRIIRIHRHNFFLLAFEVQILTKTRQNHEYLQTILQFKIHKITDKSSPFRIVFLATKLLEIDKITRQYVMNEINNLMFRTIIQSTSHKNLQPHTSQHQQPYSLPSQFQTFNYTQQSFPSPSQCSTFSYTTQLSLSNSSTQVSLILNNSTEAST
ncbi:hypothetical protein AGLY_011917 [Aphis glycines]|uniref:Uncharacterized protein n=1 Tax=Aphis glycines TaxID=307491 RepID=A0A6G0TAX3_APHGL|nr:hypothetical protein AGLY_011917 [Aphis glycines]